MKDNNRPGTEAGSRIVSKVVDKDKNTRLCGRALALAKAGKIIRTTRDFMDYLEPLGLGRTAGGLRKADAPLLTTTGTGNWQAVAGARATYQLVLGGNSLAAIPKKPYTGGALRVVSAAGDVADLGIGEGAARPESKKPTFARGTKLMKQNWVTFDESAWLEACEDVDDSLTWEEFAFIMGEEFVTGMNNDAHYDAGTLAGNDMESFDRAAMSYSEYANCADHNAAAYASGDQTFEGITRAEATYWDAQVGHISGGADRTLTTGLIDAQIALAEPYQRNGEGKLMMTRASTKSRIEQYLSASMRYAMQPVRVTQTVNGYKQGVGGQETGMMVSAYKNHIIVTDNAVATDTIPQILGIDTDFTWLEQLIPIKYGETGSEIADMLAIGVTTKMAAHWTICELVCAKPAAQWKLRDLA